MAICACAFVLLTNYTSCGIIKIKREVGIMDWFVMACLILAGCCAYVALASIVVELITRFMRR